MTTAEVNQLTAGDLININLTGRLQRGIVSSIEDPYIYILMLVNGQLTRTKYAIWEVQFLMEKVKVDLDGIE